VENKPESSLVVSFSKAINGVLYLYVVTQVAAYHGRSRHCILAGVTW